MRGGVEDVGQHGGVFRSWRGVLYRQHSGRASGHAARAGPASRASSRCYRTGLLFSLLQGAFFQIGTMFSGDKKQEEDLSYAHTRGMLMALGLQDYENNFKKGLLNDATLPLLTDSALKEVKIPPGPRLRILQHVSMVRTASASRPGSVGQQPAPALGPLSLAIPV